jgi:RHS repeat-associated protein
MKRSITARPVTLTTDVSYLYDVFGNSIAKEFTVSPAGSGYSNQYYVIENGESVMQFGDGSNPSDPADRTLQVINLYADAVDQILASDTLGGLLEWALADAQGTITDLVVRGVMDSVQRSYDAFGTPLAAIAGPVSQGFAGQIYDPETGLYYDSARYYNPTGGRFLSPDPAGFAAGDPNLYRYCGNSPTMLTDPSGQWAVVDDAVTMAGGFICGVVGQGVGDLLNGRSSGWEAYVGAGMGGAAAAETMLYTANPMLAGMAGGAVSNATTQGLRMASGAQPSFDLSSLAIATGVGGLSGLFGSVVNTMTAPLGRVISNGLTSNLALSPALSCFVTSTILSGVNGMLTGGAVGAVVGGFQGYVDKGWEGVLPGAYQGAATAAGQDLSNGLLMGAIDPFICFTAGTLVHKASGKRAIESLRVGQRALTEGTKDAADRPGDDPTGIDPANCRLVRLRTAKPIGSDNILDAELIRPLSWLEANSAVVGGVIHFAVPDLGIDGPADVLAVEPCPEIESGRGRVITGTFTTARCSVLELRLAGQERALEPTPPHRLKSLDRGDYVPAEDLKIGERLATRSGQVATVESLGLKPGLHRVYNLEIEGEHHYFVGEAGVLVHNAYAWEEHQERVAQSLKADNPGAVIQEQIKLRVTGPNGLKARIQPDNLMRTPNGWEINEAKFGEGAKLAAPDAPLAGALTGPQKTAFPWIANGQAQQVVPYGQNALKAGFAPGRPITVSPNIRIHVNGSNGIVVRQFVP